jgi:hypothetical protein
VKYNFIVTNVYTFKNVVFHYLLCVGDVDGTGVELIPCLLAPEVSKTDLLVSMLLKKIFLRQ